MSAPAYDALVHDGEALRPVQELGKSDHRVRWIDGARGLSIVAMIASHVGYISGTTPEWFHLYLMRPFAPMFLLLLGLLWRPGFRRRHVQFGLGLVASQVLAAAIGFPVPNILLLMGVALLVAPVAVRFPHAAIALSVTQLMFWPMPDWWTGYAPGFVLALFVAGATIPADGLVRNFGRLGDWLCLGVVGRFPLTFYLGHLALLFLYVYEVAA